MRVVRNPLTFVALLAVGLALASPEPGRAADQTAEEPPQQSPEEMAREGLERMMSALRLLVESIPQYELPEILENGDIIIRRVHPEKKPVDPEVDETAT